MIILYYEWKRYWKAAIKTAVLCALLILMAIPFLPFVQEPNLIGELRSALDMFPDIVLSFFGLHAQQSFLNPTRYVSFVFIFIYAIGGLFAAWLGGRCFSKERADGTIDFLLQKPLHRWQIMLYKIVANLFAMITFLFVFCALYRGVIKLYSLFKLPVTPQTVPIVSLLVSLFALMTLLFSVSVLFSVLIPTDKIVVPVTLVLTVLFYVFYAASFTDSSLSAFASFSPFSYMQAQTIAQGESGPLLPFFGLSLLFLAAGFALLYNHDIRKKLPRKFLNR